MAIEAVGFRNLTAVFQAASTNAWLRERATKASFVRRSVSAFMPGERVEDAVAAATRQQAQGIGTIFTRSPPAASGGRRRARRRYPCLARSSRVPPVAVLTGGATGIGAAVTRKLGWYGAEVIAIREVARTSQAVSEVYREAIAMGAQLVLFAGASAIDPLDPAYAELATTGGELLQLGAPMHPGSMLWLGRLGQAAVVGVASCAGFGRSSSLDLLLPFVFAYGRADAGDLRRLGHGGLIESGAGRRFPPYS